MCEGAEGSNAVLCRQGRAQLRRSAEREGRTLPFTAMPSYTLVSMRLW